MSGPLQCVIDFEGERGVRALRSELTFCSKVRHGYIERSRKKPSARAFCCAEVTCPPCFLGFLAIVDVRASPKLLENQGAARARRIWWAFL